VVSLFQAQLKGKLYRREEDMEDLLTSNVFGSLKYVPPEEGLSRVLASAEDSNGGNEIPLFNEIVEAQYDFWPQLKELFCNPCEQDVLIHLKLANGQKAAILVEAKYRSDKSSIADDSELPTDQLAREWHNLIKLTKRINETPYLLYVTADIIFPLKSILDSQDELRKKNLPKINILWISWRKIYSLFAKAQGESIMGDLAAVLEKQGLTFYQRRPMKNFMKINWSFNAIEKWNWTYNTSIIEWRFHQSIIFNWQIENSYLGWRFNN
jgi:hypothetical protein